MPYLFPLFVICGVKLRHVGFQQTNILVYYTRQKPNSRVMHLH